MILSQYASTLGADTPVTGKRLSMTIDDVYRLQLLEQDDGRILVRARLRSLPEAGPERDEAIRHCARLVCGRMLKTPVTCSIDKQNRAIWLQQLCHVTMVEELDDHIGQFVNELPFWLGATKD